MKKEFSRDDLGFLKSASNELLNAVARGDIDLNQLALMEIASREKKMKFLIKKDIGGMHGIYAGDKITDNDTAHLDADFHLLENGIQMTNVNGKWQYINIPGEIFDAMRDRLAEFILSK